MVLPTSDDSSDADSNLLLDFPSKPRMLTESRRQASKQLAVRRAVTVASASIANKIQDSHFSEDYVRFAKEKIALDSCILEAELGFIDRLREMDHEDRVDTLFELFDKDGSGLIEIREMESLLYNRIKEINVVREAIPHLEQSIQKYAAEEALDRELFCEFVELLKDDFKCDNFLDLCLLLSQTVSFNEDGRKVLEDAIRDTMTRGELSDAQFDLAVFEARMILVFSMLDNKHNGIVSFRDVVKHLLKLSENMDEQKRQVLLMVDTDDVRTLDRGEFLELMMNFLSALDSTTTFHELADSITLSVARNDVSDNDIGNLMTDWQGLIDKAHVKRNVKICEYTESRLWRLFDMLDTNHDETLDRKEVSAFFGKFDESALQKIKGIMKSYDKNHDGHLNFDEFCNMIIQFAGDDVKAHRLIDYLCIQCALKDDNTRRHSYNRTRSQLTKGDTPMGGIMRTLSNRQSKRMSFMGLMNKAKGWSKSQSM